MEMIRSQIDNSRNAASQVLDIIRYTFEIADVPLRVHYEFQ